MKALPNPNEWKLDEHEWPALSSAAREDWAPLVVRSLLSAGVDTTVNGITASIYSLTSHQDQWSLLEFLFLPAANPSFCNASLMT